MRTMREIADRVLVIFEFEKAIYERANVPVDWVGHPLLDVMPPSEPRGTFVRSVGLAAERPVVALLPGSRRNELREILPRLVDAANRILQVVPDVQFVVARAPHLHDDLFTPLESLSSAPKVIVEGQTDRVLAEADVAIVASGTVTVGSATGWPERAVSAAAGEPLGTTPIPPSRVTTVTTRAEPAAAIRG